MHTENKNPLRGTKQGEPFPKFTKDKVNSRSSLDASWRLDRSDGTNRSLNQTEIKQIKNQVRPIKYTHHSHSTHSLGTTHHQSQLAISLEPVHHQCLSTLPLHGATAQL